MEVIDNEITTVEALIVKFKDDVKILKTLTELLEKLIELRKDVR